MTLSDLLAQGLRNGAGLPDEQAREIAANVIAWGYENGHSGDRYYWPAKFRELSPAERHEAIKREFNGRNLAEVCRRHGVKSSTVYRAIHS